MNKIIISFCLFVFIFSCGGNQGALVGGSKQKWNPTTPVGMTLIPGGSFAMGKSDEDVANLKNSNIKTVTVRSFYIDETEITNNEYRQFVNWVKDSITYALLARKADELGVNSNTDEESEIALYAFSDSDTTNITEFQKYMKENYYDLDESGYTDRDLNWDIPIEWNPNNSNDRNYIEALDSILLHPSESLDGSLTIDVTKLIYKYKWIDIKAAIMAKSKERAPFIKDEEVLIYPDTTVWIKDFIYSYNEPMHNEYFWHPAFTDYPVVGINWYQATAFCHWRTSYINKFLREKKRIIANKFRLPSESEWEYAARGGIPSGTYPWGGPYLMDEKGCFLANFKPLRGNYVADNALYTVEVKSYLPNDYNLYNMSGNVSEWTGSSYEEGAYHFEASINPDINLLDEKRKVIRGGSWKDVAYFLRVSTRDYEYADTSRSYIGFRTVQDYLGTRAVSNR